MTAYNEGFEMEQIEAGGMASQSKLSRVTEALRNTLSTAFIDLVTTQPLRGIPAIASKKTNHFSATSTVCKDNAREITVSRADMFVGDDENTTLYIDTDGGLPKIDRAIRLVYKGDESLQPDITETYERGSTDNTLSALKIASAAWTARRVLRQPPPPAGAGW